jgi:uncharacterized protein (TIGR02246 family)
MSQAVSAFDFRGAIERAIAVFESAANAKDAASIARLYTEDATFLPPGAPPIKGRANIQQFWQGFFQAGASDGKLHIVDVVSLGDIAYEIGAFEANLPTPQGGKARTEGKDVVIWKRQSDGNIQIAVDIFNTNT